MLAPLPANQIQRARQVYRHLRSTIDQKGNAKAIVEPGQKLRYIAPAGDMTKVLNVGGDQAVLLGVRERIVCRRRLESNSLSSFAYVASAASHLWISRHQSAIRLQEADPKARQKNSKIFNAFMLMIRTAHCAEPALLEAADSTIRGLVLRSEASCAMRLRRFAIRVEPFVTSAKVRDVWTKKLLDQDWPEGALKSRVASVPLCLTAMFCPPLDGGSRLFLHGIYHPVDVEVCLGLSRFLDIGNASGQFLDVLVAELEGSHFFAYAVCTEWTYRRIRRALKGHKLKSHEMAALLDQIYIY